MRFVIARDVWFCRWLVTLLLVLGFAMAGCKRGDTAAVRGVEEQVLYRGNGTEPESLDPHLVRGGPEWIITGALFEGLVTPDPETGEPTVGAAAAWEVSADGLTYIFRLNPAAKWSNGDPVTAEDFVWSARRLTEPRLGSAHVEDTLSFVRGVKDYQAGRLEDFSAVGIRATDDGSLEFVLEYPAPFFLSALYQFYPVHRASIETAGDWLDRSSPWTRPGHLVGNGPFRLQAWRSNQRLVVEKNPHYWDADRVRLQGVHFLPYENPATEEAAFRNGQLHLTNTLPLQKISVYERESPGQVKMVDDLGVYFYTLNVSRPPLDDVRVRRALALAVDRETLARRLLQGGREPAASFTPTQLPGYSPPAQLGFDPAAAQRLLAEAGFPGGRGFPRLELLIDSRDHHRLTAEAVQQMWRQHLGIDIALRNEETRVLIASKRTLQFDLVRGSWNATSYRDPVYFLGPWVTEGLYNEAKWSQPRYDALLAQVQQTADPVQRLATLHAAETLLLEELPIIPLYHTAQVFLMSPHVRGWQHRPFNDRLMKYLWLE
jgi:oligopeptide transport system substrate-binding protein